MSHKSCVRDSPIHGKGVFAKGNFRKQEVVAEYRGEKIPTEMYQQRKDQYVKEGIVGDYMFALDASTLIDGTKKGNKSRYINHSCAANSYSVCDPDQGKLYILTKRAVKTGEEITIDYHFEKVKDTTPMVCRCGAVKCKGSMN